MGPKGIELQGVKVISLLPREYVPLEILRQMRVRLHAYTRLLFGIYY